MKSHGHSSQEIIDRLNKKHRQSYLRDWVYGGIDGAVSTFAVVAGVVGANLSSVVILIIGMANLLGDGFSMAAANFLGTKAEEEEFNAYEAIERKHIERFPEGERQEIRQIFKNKGFEGKLLEDIITKITSDKPLWIKTMLHEEYGLGSTVRSAWKAGGCTFFAFIVCGSVPILPFILREQHAFLYSMVFTGVVFFIIGSLKSRWSVHSFWRSGVTTLLIGVFAASIAYSVGIVSKLILGTG
jgi:VIT1/CCC1 family predicted Fe2+/Mn2+ transporter